MIIVNICRMQPTSGLSGVCISLADTLLHGTHILQGQRWLAFLHLYLAYLISMTDG